MPKMIEGTDGWSQSILLPPARVSNSKYIENPVHQGLLYVSGQLPYEGEDIHIAGLVGDTVDISAAREAARLCATNALATVNAELGNLDMIGRILRLTGYVAAVPGFVAHPAVIDAASSVLVEVLGPRGKHARTAIGVSSLPRNAPVEIELVVAVAGEGLPSALAAEIVEQ